MKKNEKNAELITRKAKYIPLSVRLLTFKAEEGFAASVTGDASQYGGSSGDKQENQYDINDGVWD